MSDEDSLDGVLGMVKMGRWQLLALLINCLIWSVLAPHTIGTTLLNAPVAFKCSPVADPYFDAHSIPTSKRKVETPPVISVSTNATSNSTSNATDVTFDSQCFDRPPLHILPGVFDTDNTSWAVDDHGGLHKLQAGDEHLIRESNNRQTLLDLAAPSCPAVQYDDAIFTSTVTTEWNLICENSLERQLFQNTYTIGIMVGCVIGGDIGDRFGRVTAIRMGSLLHVISSLIVAFTTNFTTLMVARFLLGLTNLAILVPAVTLALETCPAHLRGTVGMGIGLPYSLGVMLFGGFGYLLRSWRHLYMATSFPAFMMLPVSFFLDESPRWLLQQGDLTKARAVLHKAAKLNKTSLPPNEELDPLLLQVSQQEKVVEDGPVKSISLVSRMRSAGREVGSFVRGPSMRVISIVTPINWVFSEIIYYGIIFNANNFSNSNPFLYVALTGVSDAAAILIGAPISSKIGRRNTVGGAQFLAGVLTILVLAVPNDLWWLQWVFVMGGFLMSAAAAQILYVYTPELYPTTLRTRGFAFCNLTGYAGAFFAPFIPEVLATYGWWVTDLTLGLCGIIGGLIIFLLPETKDRVLCETVEDVEERAKNNKNQKENKKNSKKRGTTEDKSVNTDNNNKQSNELTNGLNRASDGSLQAPSDGEIVKSIVLSNSLNFMPNKLLRSSISRSGSGSINCLLETETSLSTSSFGTNNVPSFNKSTNFSEPPNATLLSSPFGAATNYPPSGQVEIPLNANLNTNLSTIFGSPLGTVNELFEKDTTKGIEISTIMKDDKKAR